MDKIKNLSIRKTILLYMAISLTCSFFLSAAVIRTATVVQKQIWMNYVDMELYSELISQSKDDMWIEIPRPQGSTMSRKDYRISESCDFLQTYTVLIVSIVGSCIAVFCFYKHKLKRPIQELSQASKQIAQNNLEVSIAYRNADEMGQLCVEFERMRKQLEENNQELWRTIEEERALRAAISHDIRSPLSVLKGYQEMLMEYLPNGTIDTKRAVEMVEECVKQSERMDSFVETMRKMSSLEQRELLWDKVTAQQLETDIQAELDILEKDKHIILTVPTTDAVFIGDKEVILEVAENLLSNALRYAKEQIEVLVHVTASKLTLRVSDDGEGFQEEAGKVAEVFHQRNVKDSLKHAGLGMYISRLYCEKHGGNLVIENEKQGGAVVTAIFRRIV